MPTACSQKAKESNTELQTLSEKTFNLIFSILLLPFMKLARTEHFQYFYLLLLPSANSGWSRTVGYRRE